MPTAEDLSGWLALDPEALLRRCAQTPFQGPGPGGQKRNRVYSGVRLHHAESGLSAEASERREARRNLGDALHRLRMAMALSLPAVEASSPEGASPEAQAVAGGPSEAGSTGDRSSGDAPIPPPPGGIAFRPGAKASHADYPRLVFAALLALELRLGRLSGAAAGLGCSASALSRLLAADKGAWARAQAIRRRRGLHPLKHG